MIDPASSSKAAAASGVAAASPAALRHGLPEPYVLIDLETTGANPLSDRITEIALIRVENGAEVVRWEHLVNPEQPIPAMIQRLVGITDAMVAQAPTFAELAETLKGLLAGAVFVAHNARFDYGFLRNAYARLGQTFDAPVLCTVKLSRALYPNHHRHGLDALIERHGLHCNARHRAMGDVEVLQQFIALVERDHSPEALTRACEKAMKSPDRPAWLDNGVLEGLPEAGGLYLFYGGDEQLLYVGRSTNLRARVSEHFASGRKGKQAELARKVRRIEWQECAGELEAALRELALVRTQQPVHNPMPEGGGSVFGYALQAERKRGAVLRRVSLAGSDPRSWHNVHGVFRTPREGQAMLRELARLYNFCLRRLGLEADGRGACAAYRQHNCAGACVGKESSEQHDARLAAALAGIGVKAWPWPGAVVVEEHSEHADRRVWHVIDHWCHLGSVHDEAALQALLAGLPQPAFDLDLYRLLQRWLSQPELAADIRALPSERAADDAA